MAEDKQPTVPDVVANIPDADIFKQAMAPDPEPPPKPEGEPQATPPEGEQPRDERGRFAKADQAPQAPAAATQQQPDPAQQPPAQQPTDDGGTVPSWRHRELREQRDA